MAETQYAIPPTTPLIIHDTRCVSIAGAGLAGTLLAIRLADHGFNIKLYERFPDPAQEAVPSGRSINLALAERGRHALAQAGLLSQVDQISIPMAGRMVHKADGEQSLHAYGQRPEEVIYSVHRDQLSRMLLDCARQRTNIEFYFYHRLDQVNFRQRQAQFVDDRDQSIQTHAFEILIGADGVGSALRRAMETEAGQISQTDLLDHAYREFTIPPNDDGEFAIEPNALHIWPRGGFMLIALPNADRSFTATLFLAREGKPGFANIPEDLESWQQFLQQHFSSALPLLSQLESDLKTHPVSHLGTLRCSRWHWGTTFILGDAAHAVVPFHGQGMNAAFEDVDVLIQLLGKHQSWHELMVDFQQQRKPNTDALAAMALENYEEMRQGVRDPNHLRRKALEWELERQFPHHFIPRYSMVMFHRIPYAEAMERGRIQSDIMNELLCIDDDDERQHQAAHLIHQRLDKSDEKLH